MKWTSSLRWVVTTTILARFGLPASEERVSPFFVANMRVSYPLPQLSQKGEVFVEVENILNRQYEYTPGYPSRERRRKPGSSQAFDPAYVLTDTRLPQIARDALP